MFEYLTKFKQLPAELRLAVASPLAVAAISALEKKYGVGLDAVVMKVMVKEISWTGLAEFLTSECHLPAATAEKLRQELAESVFYNVTGYLGIKKITDIKTQPPMSVAAAAPRPPVRPLAAAAPSDVPPLVADVLPAALRLAGIADTQGTQSVRLHNVINIFFKGIRDALDTRETLMKPVSEGGLGLDQAKAGGVVALLKEAQSGQAVFSPAPVSRRPASAFTDLEQVRDVEYEFAPSPAPLTASPADKLTPPPLESGNQSGQNKTFTISPEKVKQAERLLRQKAEHTPSAAAPAQVPRQTVAPQCRRNDIVSVSLERVRMDDILQPPVKLQGPLEELAGIDLTIFRRLGERPENITKKISNKIKLLEQESISKRQQGVNAWRHSPVHAQYLALGQESFDTGRSVADIIAARKKNSQDVLTADEFEAIAELNLTLRV